MRWNKNNLDEMQEHRLLTIERNAYWFLFWGLLLSILIQTAIIGENSFKYIAGEWVLFILVSLYVGISSIRSGIWDRKLKPNLTDNLKMSLVGGSLIGITYFISSYLKYNNIYGSIATGVIMLIGTSVLCFIALSLTALLYNKKVHLLENEIDE